MMVINRNYDKKKTVFYLSIHHVLKSINKA